MQKTLVKARRLGGSLIVRIPKELADQEEIVEGELVEVEFKKARKDWFGAFKKLKPFTKEEELDEK